MEHEGDNYTNRDWCFWYSHQSIIKGTGGLGGRRTRRDHPNYNIFEKRPEYWDESWKHEETCCLSNSSERPSAKTDVKKSQGVNNNNNNNCCYFTLLGVFHINICWWFSYWGLSDNKSPQVSRTLLSILADLNNTIGWMVSTCPLIFKCSRLFINPLRIVPSAPTTTGITVTFMFHRFFSSLAKSVIINLL